MSNKHRSRYMCARHVEREQDGRNSLSAENIRRWRRALVKARISARGYSCAYFTLTKHTQKGCIPGTECGCARIREQDEYSSLGCWKCKTPSREDSRFSATGTKCGWKKSGIQSLSYLRPRYIPAAVRSFEIYFARLARKIYLLKVTVALVLRDSRVLRRDLIGEH